MENKLPRIENFDENEKKISNENQIQKERPGACEKEMFMSLFISFPLPAQ